MSRSQQTWRRYRHCMDRKTANSPRKESVGCLSFNSFPKRLRRLSPSGFAVGLRHSREGRAARRFGLLAGHPATDRTIDACGDFGFIRRGRGRDFFLGRSRNLDRVLRALLLGVARAAAVERVAIVVATVEIGALRRP